MQTKLLSWAGSGGTRNALTKGMIESFDVPAPEDINEQRAIAHILGTLDDKIELNRRISETLEAMARALFKSWFVDFDPVHAKAARLPAGRTAASTPPWPKRGTWCVYALECEGGSVYIGHTAHLERRFEEHSKGKGADWTKRYPPKRVAYWEEAPTQAAAIEREKNLKSGSGREGLKLEIAERDEESGTLPQPPCLPVRQVADLFPARLVDSELGEIPEGWEVGTLADLSIVNPEVWTKETRPAELNYVDLSNTKWGRIEVVASYQAADAPSRAQRVLRPADTIIGTVRPGNGSYALISEHGLTGSTGFAVLRPQTAEYAAFIYLAATAADNIDTLAHLADGAAYPAVRPEVVAATPIVRPNPEVFDRFSWAAGPLLAKIAQNERESRTLAALRDTLLPRLISGELRVENVDRIPTDKRRLPC
jgi:predicted GIY-YIG superfamily endonuclease